MNQDWKEGLINIFRDEGKYYNHSDLMVGVVKSLAPLQIVIGDLPLNRNRLYVDRILEGYTEKVNMNINNEDTTATITHPSVLQVGDSVFLYEVSDTKFYVMGVVD